MNLVIGGEIFQGQLGIGDWASVGGGNCLADGAVHGGGLQGLLAGDALRWIWRAGLLDVWCGLSLCLSLRE